MKIGLKTAVTGSSKRWGQVFVVFLVVGTLLTWIDSMMLFNKEGRLPEDTLILLILMVPIIPVNLMLLIPPMFFGGYPAWIVAIFGEKFLNSMVRGLFQNHSKNSTVKERDKNALEGLLKQRFGLAALIILAFIAGVVSAFL